MGTTTTTTTTTTTAAATKSTSASPTASASLNLSSSPSSRTEKTRNKTKKKKGKGAAEEDLSDPEIPDASVLARGTPGVSGAGLANIFNSAALKASTEGSSGVRMSDLEW